MPYQKVDDIEIFYEEIGCGKPVLFLHSAYSRGILAFGGQIQPFYAEGYRCLLPDYRGHGRTKSASLEWNSAQIAEDMIGLLDNLKIDKVNLLGYSTGGGVAYYMAARHPERVQTVISIGNGGVADSVGADDFLPEALIKQGAYEFIEKMKNLHVEAHGGDWQEYLRQEVNDWKEHPHLEENEWKKITAPMLLIAGEKDDYANRECLEQIKRRCPQAEIFIVEGCGHRPHFSNEEAKKVNEKMFTFLREYA